jgi:16S rRNA G966 N2-methylase RsmD
VEADRRTATRLHESVLRFGLAEKALVVEATVVAFAGRQGSAKPFDIVFFDPPWAAQVKEDLESLVPLVAPAGVLVHERGDDDVPELPSLGQVDVRRYGRTRLILYRR